MRVVLRAVVILALVALAVQLLPDTASIKGSAWSLLPPLVAITLALVFRDVLVSLFLGVWLGTTMLAGGQSSAPVSCASSTPTSATP